MHFLLSLFASVALASPLLQRANREAHPITLPLGIPRPNVAGFKHAVVRPSRGGEAICVSGQISVSASTDGNFNLDPSMIPSNQTEVTGLLVAGFSAGGGQRPQPQLQSINGTWNIGASLCLPANATQQLPSTVQLASHGVEFDRFYWDFAPGYSYVDSAVSSGHAILIYDRLGNGDSDHLDPLIVQAALELEIAHSIVNILRDCTLAGHSFDKVIGVGHSFGSGLTQSLTVAYPSLLDAAILTGYGVNGTANVVGFNFASNPTIASISDPQRFGHLSPDYMAGETVQGVQIDFFAYPSFDPEVLVQAFVQRGTQTVGEMAGGPPPGGPATNYTRPLAVVNGEQDLPYCTGNCSFPTDLAAQVGEVFYPNVKQENFASYLAPNAGHGLNLHYSAVGAFEFIQKFLAQQGF